MTPDTPILNVVLVEPEIPPNTGNIARLCAATRVALHLVEPLGFQLDDAHLRRAGMDYWRHTRWHRWPSWTALADTLPTGVRPWFVEQGGPLRYDEAKYAAGDWIVFGRESAGLPEPLVRANRQRWLRIPMFHPEARSLNLANCVSVVVYEALRQMGFPREPTRSGAEPAGAAGSAPGTGMDG